MQDTAREAGCLVTGGQTVLNPWCTVGGVASTVCPPTSIIMPEGARPGQVQLLYLIPWLLEYREYAIVEVSNQRSPDYGEKGYPLD